jgi:hypothetical protein
VSASDDAGRSPPLGSLVLRELIASGAQSARVSVSFPCFRRDRFLAPGGEGYARADRHRESTRARSLATRRASVCAGCLRSLDWLCQVTARLRERTSNWISTRGNFMRLRDGSVVTPTIAARLSNREALAAAARIQATRQRLFASSGARARPACSFSVAAEAEAT